MLHCLSLHMLDAFIALLYLLKPKLSNPALTEILFICFNKAVQSHVILIL